MACARMKPTPGSRSSSANPASLRSNLVGAISIGCSAGAGYTSSTADSGWISTGGVQPVSATVVSAFSTSVSQLGRSGGVSKISASGGMGSSDSRPGSSRAASGGEGASSKISSIEGGYSGAVVSGKIASSNGASGWISSSTTLSSEGLVSPSSGGTAANCSSSAALCPQPGGVSKPLSGPSRE